MTIKGTQGRVSKRGTRSNSVRHLEVGRGVGTWGGRQRESVGGTGYDAARKTRKKNQQQQQQQRRASQGTRYEALAKDSSSQELWPWMAAVAIWHDSDDRGHLASWLRPAGLQVRIGRLLCDLPP